MASKRQIGYKCRIAGVLLLLLTSIAALIAVVVIQDNWKSKEYSPEYGIVIDAGSSRSNVYLYEWPGDKQNETGVVSEKMNCRVPGSGISEMEVDPQRPIESCAKFKTCIDSVLKIVPVEKHKSTILFLGATAGMRLLHEENEQKSNEILAVLTAYLSSLPFAFRNASIISGQEEGLYGWITVNYLMGNFITKNLWNKYVRPEGAATVGSMDLGGASTQLAFAIQDDLRGPDYMPIKLYGYPYNVYTHSYLCYGKNEAEKRLLDKVIQQSSDPAYVLNPCYPNGYNHTAKASEIYDTECTSKPRNYNPDQEYLLVGAADSERCGQIVKSLFDFTSCSLSYNVTQCAFDGVEQPPVTGDYMAYAGYFYIARALLINGRSEMDQFNSSVSVFCNTEWPQLRVEKHWISEKYLRTYCFASHYVFTLLADGYKFDKDNWNKIEFQKEVKDTSIGWSLGYMLSMSNMIPSNGKDIFPMTNPVFAGLVFLFSALIIVTVVLVFIFIVRLCC